jgi:hypothetical protein
MHPCTTKSNMLIISMSCRKRKPRKRTSSAWFPNEDGVQQEPTNGEQGGQEMVCKRQEMMCMRKMVPDSSGARIVDS